MLTRNVYYSEQPDRVIVYTSGDKAIIEFPINVSEVEVEESTNWLAEEVYSIKTTNTANLAERVEANYDAWLDLAKQPEPQSPQLGDVVEALNALTEIVLGGDM